MEDKKNKAKKIVADLKKIIPEAKIALNYSNPLELLVATILSAQCTDKLVNIVTADLFKKYSDLESYADADLEEFQKDISRVTFYRNKAKNIIATAKIIRDTFAGKVPDNMEDLVSLPGVARKTGNVILGCIYHKPEGVVVDTHVRRLSNLLGLTTNQDPVKIEQDLMALLPKEEWIEFSLRLILYGRQYCPARPHDHSNCPLHQYYV